MTTTKPATMTEAQRQHRIAILTTRLNMYERMPLRDQVKIADELRALGAWPKREGGAA